MALRTEHQPTRDTPRDASPRFTRREAIGVGGALLVGGGVAAGLAHVAGDESGLRAEVFVGKAASYESDLAGVIRSGLRELGVNRAQIRGKRVVLKPNLVETAIGEPHINTHPAVVVAAAEALRQLDAGEIIVAEGQGHRRDSQLVLDESGMGDALREAKLPFVDLNHDDVDEVVNRARWTTLPSLHLPRTILSADLVVSMPKLKTHHWAGVTCAMKNLFGVMPGIVYGWPKNVLHYHGIPESICDINASVRPGLSIVDGIVGMEGDGPIMGTPKPLGCLVLGRCAVAVDACVARLMRLNPLRVPYLRKAGGRLGPVLDHHIEQRGENVTTLAQPFQLLDVPHLRGLAEI